MSGFVAEHRRRSNAKLINRIILKKGDITKQTSVDAIVSALPYNLDVSGSINKAIVSAAGHDFDNFILENIYKPKPGDTYVVPGFNFLNLIKSFKDCGSRIAFFNILSAVLLYILLAAVNNLPATVN